MRKRSNAPVQAKKLSVNTVVSLLASSARRHGMKAVVQASNLVHTNSLHFGRMLDDARIAEYELRKMKGVFT